MPKQTAKKDAEIIIRYANGTDGENKKAETLQELMQKLFNSYIMKSIQNIEKDR